MNIELTPEQHQLLVNILEREERTWSRLADAEADSPIHSQTIAARYQATAILTNRVKEAGQ